MKVKKKMFMPFEGIIDVSESSFKWNDGSGWKAETLIACAKKAELEPFKLYLSGLHIGEMPFKVNDVYDMVVHIQRAANTDLQYPVILSDTGLILDGWHRVLKAILAGKEYIYAVRFTLNPDTDIKKPEGTKDG